MTAHRLIRIARVFACVAGTTIGAACGEAPPSPVGPSNLQGPAVTLAVTGVAPVAASSGSIVRIFGTGFDTGATVTMGGIVARIVYYGSSSTIDVIAPNHDHGPADVVVTNPGGASVTLTGGFRFTTVTISVSADVVTAGGELTVSWIVPDQNESSLVRGAEDAINLWSLGGKLIWREETTGTSSGTRTISAPTEPGQYEFQYRDFNDLRNPYARIMGRSRVVTVTAAASSGARPQRP